MKSILFFLVSLLITGCSDDKQVNQPSASLEKDKKEYLVKVDKMPIPEGGTEAILAKVVYPAEAKEKGIQGKVIVQAYIDSDGKVKVAEVLQGVNPLLDKAALDAVREVNFTPGYHEGKAVKTQIIIPIVFKLNGDSKKDGTSLNKKSGEYYLEVDEMPAIIGGMNAVMQKVVYPESERKAGQQGLVVVQIYIDEKGNIEKKEIAKGVNPELDKAALNAFNDIKFTPGKADGNPVKVTLAVPVRFKLQ